MAIVGEGLDAGTIEDGGEVEETITLSLRAGYDDTTMSAHAVVPMRSSIYIRSNTQLALVTRSRRFSQ